ncbi:MAG TPA: divergent PAP2 family protein [Candidatus Deferrimicrobium sp.]|nr:divergent PAP2 family protein [Candidatus Deferrimicrobium sp.]
MQFVSEILANRILEVALGAWATAQILKVLFALFIRKKLDWNLLTSSGGMPSSHSALVSALTISIGHNYGFDSAMFALAAVFSLIVMYDAAGVRRAAGKQAEALNQIIAQIYRNHEITQERLKELIGHTPIEVFAGCALGIAFALFY